jgi:O-antigen/teichoic acid export membrane protein
MSFLRNLASVLTTQVAIAPLGLAASIVLARLLSVHDRGVYAVATEFAAVAVVVGQAGWPPTSIYRIRRDGAAPAEVATAAVFVWLAVSLLVVGFCFALRDALFGAMFVEENPIVLYLALAIIPFQLLGVFFTGLARALNLFLLHNAYQFLFSALSLLVIGGALFFGDQRAVVALATLLCVHVIVGVGLFVLVVRRSGLRFGLPTDEFRSSASFGMKSYAQNVLLNVHQRADIFLLAYFLADPGLVAIYAVAVGLANRARIVPNAIATAMFPAVAGLSGQQLGGFVARILRHSLTWMLVTVILLAAVAPLLIPLLFGEQYGPSVLPFLLLLPGTAFLTGYMVVARYFSARNLHEANLAVLGVSIAVNIGLNIFLIPRYGVVGAGLSSLVSYALQGAGGMLIFVWGSGENWRACVVLDRSDWQAYRQRACAFWDHGRRMLRPTPSPESPGSNERNRW